MNIDLAAFRLQALTTLTSGSASVGGSGAGGSDFLSVLTNARSALSGGASAGSGIDSLLSGESSRASSVLAQLQASNAAFMQRYNDRVEQIGDEAEVLTQLRTRVAELGQASQGLENLSETSSNADVKAAVKDFIGRYNAWDSEFDPYFENGALLDDNQAGEVARFSLRREVGSIFHGAGNGGFAQGLTDMGVKFSPDGQLSLDEAAFDAAMSSNRSGALQSLKHMANAFGDTAEMLTADGHLLDRRIDNAERAVDWAAAHQQQVEAEFGADALLKRYTV